VQHGGNRRFQPLVGITNDEPDAGQTTGYKAAQKREPEGAIFPRFHIASQDFSLHAIIHANGDHHCGAHHPAIPPDLQIRRVERQIGIAALQSASPKALHLGVQVGTEARRLALADPRHSQAPHQVIHPPGGNAMHIRFLHHCHQGTLRPLARIKK
jgi:hypothetical protein